MERNLSVSGGFCVGLAAMLLLLPLKWVAAFLLAACFHEFCHWAAIFLCTHQSQPVALFSYGARMALPPMSHSQALLCALAGPLGGLVLLLFARWLPRTAICAGFQSFYNLLPMYPMDGGRALESALALFLPQQQVESLCAAVERLCIASLFLLGFYGWFALGLGMMPLCIAAFFLVRIKISKMPCKVGRLRVQ